MEDHSPKTTSTISSLYYGKTSKYAVSKKPSLTNTDLEAKMPTTSSSCRPCSVPDQESADHTVSDFHIHDGCQHVLPQEITMKDAKQRLNGLYDFKESKTRDEYHRFNANQKSAVDFSAVLLALFVCFLLPLAIVLLKHDVEKYETTSNAHVFRMILSIISLFSAVVGSGLAVGLYVARCWKICPFAYRMNNVVHNNCPALFASFHTQMPLIYQHLLFQIQLSLVTIFLRRAFDLNCLDTQPWLNQITEGYCYEGHEAKESMLIFNAFVMMIFPVLFFIILAEAPINIVWINLSFSSVVYFAAIFLMERYRSLLSMGMWWVIAFYLVTDTQIRGIMIFLTNQKLRDALLENERISQENRAQEMRTMIANVAHDLKTPLSSFTTGVDFIQHFVDEMKVKMYENSLTEEYLQENTEVVQACVNNIRNTNSFMLMTINRCIDYTKASKGLKLVPRYETIDMLETLQLPMSCMQNIQNRIEIVLKEIPNEICSHIITDKQWLQENILCLLSNSVKYSSEGLITITVRLVPHMNRGISDNSASTGEEKKREIAQNNSNHVSITTKTVVLTSSSDPSNPTQTRQGSPNSTTRVYPIRDNSQGSNVDIKMTDKISLDDAHDKMIGKQHSFRKSLRMLAILQAENSSSEILPRSNSLSKFEHCHLRFDIEDTGIGMSEEAMVSLFNPFKQTQRLAGGTGLGLYSLAKRVEALNGEYGVRKRRDGKQGSLFWFSIPYKPDEISSEISRQAVADSRVSSPQVPKSLSSCSDHESFSPAPQTRFFFKENSNDSAVASNPPTLTKQSSMMMSATNAVVTSKPTKSLHVLIVDDSPAIVKMTTMMLKKLGFAISHAENGQIAVQSVEREWERNQQCYDVILMDLQMPVMDGLEATRRIRKLEKGTSDDDRITSDASITSNPRTFFPRQVIIGLSANSDHETMEQALEAGVDTFMNKPFNMVTFFDTLYKLDIINDANTNNITSQQQSPQPLAC